MVIKMNLKFESLLKKYVTARIDIKNFGNRFNNIIIVENNDSDSEVFHPNWFLDDEGLGTIVESCNGVLDLKIKCIQNGKLKILLRGVDVRDKHKQRFPIYIDYTNFSVNENVIIDSNTLTWHDNSYVFEKYVHDSEILNIHVEWLPFNECSEFNIENSQEQIQSLEFKLAKREEQINSIPRLCDTTLGYSVLEGRLTYRNWTSFAQGFTLMGDFDGHCDDFWFTRYLKNKFPEENFKINIFSVSNAHDNLDYPMYGKKVLYTMEDLNYRYLEMKFRFNKYALDYVDFAMGYDFLDNPKYLRLPYWILTNFSPEVTEEEIEDKVNMWNTIECDKSRDVASISGHDRFGTRTLIDKDINSYIDMIYAGKWKNNTSELWNKYNNNKNLFLKEFKFNMCPENLLDDGYVTEKIFDALNCDCIPLYAGGGNYLEPKVLNPKAILRWTGDRECGFNPDLKKNAYFGHNDVHYPVKWVADDNQNDDVVELFKNLLTDKRTYDEFKDQDKVLSSSTKFIKGIFSDLEKHFERLIYS